MTSANVKIMAPAKNASIVSTIPRCSSPSTTISNTTAAISIPAPNAVKNNTCCSEKFLFCATNAPTKEVPPANAVIAITVRISVISIAVVSSHLARRTYRGSICLIVLFDDHLQNSLALMWLLHNGSCLNIRSNS